MGGNWAIHLIWRWGKVILPTGPGTLKLRGSEIKKGDQTWPRPRVEDDHTKINRYASLCLKGKKSLGETEEVISQTHRVVKI